MLLLQILSAVLFFLNKIYVRQKKAIGWIYGIIGAIVITIYFYLQMILQHKANLWIMIVLDIALVFLMLYGYLVAKSKKGTKFKEYLEKRNLLFKSIIVAIIIFVCTLLLIEAITSQLVIIQFFFAILTMFGTLFLALDKKIPNIAGWIFLFIAHVICTYIMFKTDSPIIAVFQILSALVALDGIRKELER